MENITNETPVQPRSSEPVLLNRQKFIAYLNVYRVNDRETAND